MLTQNDVWNIIGSYKEQNGLARHQLDSFNSFLTTGIQQIIDQENSINIDEPTFKYKVSFGQIHIPRVMMTDAKRKIVRYTPAQARIMNMCYDSPLYVDITERYEKDGDVETLFHRRVEIARIPIMVGSCKCNLYNKNTYQRIKAGECENDPQGYFIVKGNERVLIGQLRGCYNKVIVTKKLKTSTSKKDPEYIYSADMRSMSEETGHSVLIQAIYSSVGHNINFSLHYIKTPIPVGIVFKALGILEDDDILALISSESDRALKTIIRSARFISTQEEALEYIGQYSLHTIAKDDRTEYARQVINVEMFPHLGITSTSTEKVTILGYIVTQLLSTVFGTRQIDDIDDYINKRVDDAGTLCFDLTKTLFKQYINSIVKKLEKKSRKPDIRSIISKETGITKGLRYCFGTGNWGVRLNSYIRQGVSQILCRMTYASSLSHLRRINIPGGKEGQNSKMRAIHTSQYGFICPTETPEGKPVGVVLNLAFLPTISQRMPTVIIRELLEKNSKIKDLSYDSLISTNISLNGIIIGKTEEPDELVSDIRKYRSGNLIKYDVSVTYSPVDNQIRICSDNGRIIRPLFVVENGELLVKKDDIKLGWNVLVKKGLIRYLDNSEIENCVVAMTFKDIGFGKEYCEIHPAMMMGIMGNMIPFPDHSPSPRNCYQCLDPNEPVVMGDGSRKKIGNIKVGEYVVTVNPKTYVKSVTKVINHYIKPTIKTIIKITTMSGRSLVCTDNHQVLTSIGWMDAGEAKDICVVEDGCTVDSETDKMKSYGGYNYHSNFIFSKNDVIFVAIESRELQPNINVCDITTESDNHSFIAGDSLVVHNCSMGKQALGIPALSYQLRVDTMLLQLNYIQKALVTTRAAEIMGLSKMPSGINSVVAILTYGGHNQEDSVILSKAAIDRGLFMATMTRTISCEEKRRSGNESEHIQVPDKSIQRKNSNYSYLDKRGIVRKGMYVRKGDVIIGKIIIKIPKEGSKEIEDCSIRVKNGEEGIIDRIFYEIAPTGYRLVKIVIRNVKWPEVGDKFASRAAQKGTVGSILNQEDLPFTRDGITPDIIINPHAIPSRMTINQLLECVLGKAGSLAGEIGDATPFQTNSKDTIDIVSEKLKKFGYDAHGYETMYNGQTGEMINAKVFIGPTYYQRLKHLVSEKMHSRAEGPLTSLTRQPREGRSRDGGLRFGEMERDCQIVQGASRFLKERLHDVSDPFKIKVCKECGNIASAIDECRVCSSDRFEVCNIPYAAKLLLDELQAMHMKTSLKLTE